MHKLVTWNRTIEPALPYLVELTQRLALGLEHLSVKERELHSNFFWSKQQPDGGFCGRTNASDLYYTAFALRGLVALGNDNQERAKPVAKYLQKRAQGKASIIDLISLVFAARLLESWSGENVFENAYNWPQEVASLLETLRRPDGGYAKSDEGQASSTYQTFLIALTYQLLEIPQPEPRKALKFIQNQQRDDGGFVEINVMRRSGTNPTAAAVGVLRILEPQSITPQLQADITKFLLDNLTEEGGLRANTQIPIADLLSTFTGLQTLWDIGSWNELEHANVLQYVRELSQSTGGFLAAQWDDTLDVEYSFYGIASLGLLYQEEHKNR